MLLFMFFVCAQLSVHGVLHALDIGADLLRRGGAVLLQQLDDGRADDGTICDARHFCGLLRGGDAKTDGAGRLGVLPHHLYNGGKVGLDLAAGAGSLYRISHDLLFVFWAWHGRCFYLRNGRSVLSNKFSAYDKLWSYQLFGRAFSGIHISKAYAEKKELENPQQADGRKIRSLFFVSGNIFCDAGAFAVHDDW